MTIFRVTWAVRITTDRVTEARVGITLTASLWIYRVAGTWICTDATVAPNLSYAVLTSVLPITV